MRDNQRSKVYTAEMYLHQSEAEMSWAEVEAYAAKVMGSTYVQAKYSVARRKIVFVKGRGGGFAKNYHFDSYNRVHYHGPVVSLGVWGRRRSVILHELAHHFAGLHVRHNWQFVAVYLDLVRHFLGQQAHDEFKASFKANRVKYRAPAKRTLTDEQRQAASERLAAARAAKAEKALAS